MKVSALQDNFAKGLSVVGRAVPARSTLPQASHVQFEAAADDTRPVLTGVHTLAEGRELTLAAADGFRLAVHTLQLKQDVPEKVEVIIPARALREIERLITDESEEVEMAINGARSQVMFKLPDVEVVATLIQGTFPNYGQLIPQSYATRTIIEMRQFLQGQ